MPPSSVVEVVVLTVDLRVPVGAHGSDDDEMEIWERHASDGGDAKGVWRWWHPRQQWRDGRVRGRGRRVRRWRRPGGAVEGEERLRIFLWYSIAVGCINAPCNLNHWITRMYHAP